MTVLAGWLGSLLGTLATVVVTIPIAFRLGEEIERSQGSDAALLPVGMLLFFGAVVGAAAGARFAVQAGRHRPDRAAAVLAAALLVTAVSSVAWWGAGPDDWAPAAAILAVIATLAGIPVAVVGARRSGEAG